MENKATFYSVTPENTDSFPPEMSSGAGPGHDRHRTSQHDDDIEKANDEDSDEESPYVSAQNTCSAVSINADPPTSSSYSTPIRARSRIWAAIGGSIGREGSYPDIYSRTPHQCQSNYSLLQEDRAASADRPKGNDVVDTNDGEMSADQCPQCGCRLTGRDQAGIRKRRNRQVSLCSVTEALPELPSSSVSAGSASADDNDDSGDSHCHSKMEKNGFDKKARSKLIFASILCLCFMTGEMVGGFLAGSLAIISDAAHLLTDFASFMISIMALYLAHRPATKKLSFGWYRIEILGAFVSILMLWVLTGILVYSAVLRIQENKYEIDAKIMLITAATGVAFNVILGTTLHQHTHTHSHGGGGGHGHSQGHSETHSSSNGSVAPTQTITSATSGTLNYGSIRDVESGGTAHEEADESTSLLPKDEGHVHSHGGQNINVKAAFIHVLGDLFQSVGVLVAAFIIYYKPEWKIADPICTFMFSLFVLVTTITIMRDIVVVLMEGTPRGINFVEVRDTFFEVEGVRDIHNLRVWSLTMDKVALSVHLAIDRKSDPHKVLKMASLAIQRRFNISETTMQVEEYVTEMVDCQDCQGPKL